MGEIELKSKFSPSSPSLLTTDHNLDDFDCGHLTLNDWLKRYAIQNQKANAAKTFVVCQENQVVGYYNLAVGSIEHEVATRRIKKGLARHPIPVMIRQISC